VTSPKARILLVEDDADLGTVLRQFLELSGFETLLARSGTEGLERFSGGSWDLCVLDVILPGNDGFTLAREIRRLRPQVPFIFLTARGQKEDRLVGLELGADDYIVKPFEADELVLRLRNILRRRVRSGHQNLTLGRFTLDSENLRLISTTQNRQLTRREADLLQLLAGRPNRLVSRGEILVALWGENDYFLGRSLDVFVSRLRKYLSEEPTLRIESVRGEGFVLWVRAGEMR